MSWAVIGTSWTERWCTASFVEITNSNLTGGNLHRAVYQRIQYRASRT